MKARNETNISIGKRIRLTREHAGLTQELLAEKIDVTTQYISDLERGVVGASVPTIIKICQVLNVSSDYILLDRNGPITHGTISDHLNKLSDNHLEIINDLIKLFLKATGYETE